MGKIKEKTGRGGKRIGAGRPKGDPAALREQRLVIRLSQEERETLESVDGDLSTWAREVLLRAAKRKS